jgi:cysteinyl-tRNA synthetase
MDDDFNSPLLIAQLFDATKFLNLVIHKNHPIGVSQWETLSKMMPEFIHKVLGIAKEQKKSSDTTLKLTGAVDLLIELRNKARENKDFETSDQIRDQLMESGIQLKDGKEGTTFSID